MTPMSQLSKSGGSSMNNQYNIVIVETLNDYYVISTAMLIRMAPIIMYVGKIHYYFMAPCVRIRHFPCLYIFVLVYMNRCHVGICMAESTI